MALFATISGDLTLRVDQPLGIPVNLAVCYRILRGISYFRIDMSYYG